jgi:hypothetical protein
MVFDKQEKVTLDRIQECPPLFQKARLREGPGPFTTRRHGTNFLKLNIFWRFRKTSEQGQATEGLIKNSGFLRTIRRVIERTESLGILLSGFAIN